MSAFSLGKGARRWMRRAHGASCQALPGRSSGPASAASGTYGVPRSPGAQLAPSVEPVWRTLSSVALTLVAASTVVTAACAPPTAPPDSSPLRPVTVGLPFMPNVQFAPLYVAEAEGFFRDEGLDVSFEYGDESDFIRLVAAGEMPAVIAGGDQVLLAHSQDVPVRYVATWYHRFPVAVLSLDPSVTTPEDLVGRSVGVPMQAGASFLGWQALLAEAGVEPERVGVEVIGFNQTAALLEGTVDAAVGYAVNEPVQLRARNHDVATIEVADWFNLVGNGLVVGTDAARDDPELVQGLVNGFLRGIEHTLADPDGAFEVSLQAVPEAGEGEQRAVQRQVLEESLRFWRPPEAFGAIDPAAWQRSAAFLAEVGLLDRLPAVEDAIDPTFVEHYASTR